MKRPVQSKLYGLLCALFLVTISSSPSRAGVIVTGDLDIVAPPPSVLKGADTSLTNGIIFQEQSGLVLPTNVSVDMTAPGTSNSANSYTPSPGTIASGNFVDVWFLHTDPTGSVPTVYIGTATFDTPILGIIDTLTNLDATDSTLGHTGTVYPTGLARRGLDDPDSFTLSADSRTISFDFHTAGAVDEIRVITASAVPEPSSYLLAGLGLACFAGFTWVRGIRKTMSAESSPEAVTIV